MKLNRDPRWLDFWSPTRAVLMAQTVDASFANLTAIREKQKRIESENGVLTWKETEEEAEEHNKTTPVRLNANPSLSSVVVSVTDQTNIDVDPCNLW